MTVTPSTPKSPFTPITRNARVNSPKARSAKASRQPKRGAQKRVHSAQKRYQHEEERRHPQPADDGPCDGPEDVPTIPYSEPAGSPKSLPRSPLDSSVIILDWDDTLLASTHLATLGYRLEMEQEFSPSLRQQLDHLQDQVIAILEALISSVGADNLVIITNAERGWVELSAKKFIPEVLPTLEKCHVVSARSTFEISGSGPFEWKLLAFYHKIQQSFGFRIPPPLLHPESPYTGYLQRLFEMGDKAPLGPGQLPEYHPPYELERQAAFLGALPELPVEPTDDTEEEYYDAEEPAEKAPPPEPRVLAGGGTAPADPQEDKENRGAGDKEKCPPEKRRAPRSMLLDEQNNYTQEDETVLYNPSGDEGENQHLVEGEEQFDDLIPPNHLQDAGLEFQLAEDHEQVSEETKYVISFGDSLAEKHAAYGVVQNMPSTTLKTIKFLERPSIAQLSYQLSVMEEHLDYILECRRPLDVVLTSQAQSA